MKKILNFILLALIMFQLLSCSNKKDYIEMIPADTDFVIQINPKSIAKKGNFENIEQYNLAKLALTEINNADPALKDMISLIKKSPTDAGVDIISPIYIFGKKLNNKLIVTLAMNMNDKSEFEAQLKTIYKSVYKQDISFVDENNYTFIKGNKKPYLAWNKKQFMFIAGEYGTPTSDLNSFFEDLIKNENSLIDNISFSDFLKNTQDVNIWYTGNFTKYFSNKTNPSENNLDFSKSAWATYLSFNDDNISFTQKFHPDPATKIELEKRPMWKSKINTDFYKYFPERSYANISIGAYPANTRYILNNKNIISDFLNEYTIDYTILENSFEGEALFSIYDFESAKSFSVNDYFGKKETFEKTIIIPQFILAGRMKNKDFYNHFISNFGKGIVSHGNYHSLKINTNQSIYFSFNNNIMFVTNNQIQVTNFALNRVSKNNFIQSPFSSGAKNSMFANVNLNLEDYPIEVKNYFIKNSPIPITNEMEKFVNQFSKIEFKVTDEYTKTGNLQLKKSDVNSLETILLFLDQTYSVYSNPGILSNGSN